MNYKFGICGPFDFEEKQTGGQSVKTREFYYALCNQIGKEKIYILESTGYKKNPIKFMYKFFFMLRRCENIVILPAQNGIRVFAPICYFMKGKTKIHYSVIGGWLPDMLKSNIKLLRYIQKFDTVFVETNSMKVELEILGLNNVKRLYNFKNLNPVSNIHGTYCPVKLCYFSRVTKQKGIEDAIAAVEQINRENVKCILDIYGPIVDGYKTDFEHLISKTSRQIEYKGVINPTDSIEILKNYDIQLFPTRFKTEGIPGSIVDSYFAAVPVVAARWNSFADVVDEWKTGIGYKFGDFEDLKRTLEMLVDDPKIIDSMRINCLEEAKKYYPSNVIKDFFELIK